MKLGRDSRSYSGVFWISVLVVWASVYERLSSYSIPATFVWRIKFPLFALLGFSVLHWPFAFSRMNACSCPKFLTFLAQGLQQRSENCSLFWMSLMPIRAHTSDKITPSLLFDARTKFSDEVWAVFSFKTTAAKPTIFVWRHVNTNFIKFLTNFDKCEVFTCACLQRKWNSTSVALPDWPKCLRHDRYSSGCFSNFQVLLAVPPSQPKI